MVFNVHERLISAPSHDVGMLMDSLASSDDRLWPRDDWPAMRLNSALQVGAAGGHGPVRYLVTHYEPGRHVQFEFTGPTGFVGHHSFTVVRLSERMTTLRHELLISPRGSARLTWPLVFRPLHDALIEEGLDRAEAACRGRVEGAHRRSLWTKILRSALGMGARAAKRSDRSDSAARRCGLDALCTI